MGDCRTKASHAESGKRSGGLSIRGIFTSKLDLSYRNRIFEENVK